MTNDDFTFELPADLIAQQPTAERGESRLLLVSPGHGVVGERRFRELPALLRRDDLLVINESRVLPARLFTRRETSGGRVELLLIAPRDRPDTWLALARPSRRLKRDECLRVEVADGSPEPILRVVEPAEAGMVVVAGAENLGLLAERHGVMPLPPYIKRRRDDPRAAADRVRYQTVYAAADPAARRSVAAPTAGLHFDAALLDELEAAGVSLARVRLHVGPGTFQPPTAIQIASGRLHGETFHLPAATAQRIAAVREAGGRVIAVGTTSLRVLETVAGLALPSTGGPDQLTWPLGNGDCPVFAGVATRRDGHWDVAGTTRLFIAPPVKVSGADALLTNFHLPGSSLLMLVAAVMGDEVWPRVYAHAVAAEMRFFSYGDCMLILPAEEEAEP